MSDSMPIERLFWGNENWAAFCAEDEIAIYCELLDSLSCKLQSLDKRKTREVSALVNVEAVISSYSLEIGLKSLWALDNSPEKVPHTHCLLTIFNGLCDETKEKLEEIGLTRSMLEGYPKPFFSNRYSMESTKKDLVMFKASFLRDLAQLLEKTLDLRRKRLMSPPREGDIGDPQSTAT